MKALNYQKLKKSYLAVTLIDGKEILIGTPTKRVYDDLKSMSDLIDDNDNVEAMDELYRVTASVMSRNKKGVKIDKEYLENIMDIEDIIILYNAYMEFIGELSNQKN